MNRSSFLRTIAVSLAAAVSGKLEDVLPEAPSIATIPDVPGIGGKSFTLWIGKGQFVFGDIIRSSDGHQFYVDQKLRAIDIAEPDLSIQLIEADDLREYSKEMVRLSNAVEENSGSKTSIHG
jgi:hypothetical protein